MLSDSFLRYSSIHHHFLSKFDKGCPKKPEGIKVAKGSCPEAAGFLSGISRNVFGEIFGEMRGVRDVK